MENREETLHPSVYITIAKTFSGMKDFDLSIRTCDRGLTLFPGDASLYAFKGRVLVSEYNRSRKKEDILSALSSFEKCLKIEPDNYISAMLASKIYIKGRFFDKAREKINLVFAVTPGDPKATELSKVIEARESNSHGPDQKSSPEMETEQLHDAKHDSLPVNTDVLVSNLELFRELSDIELAILVDRYGMVFKSVSFTSQKHDIPRYGITVSNILRASKSTTVNTKLGNFQKGVLMTPQFFIYILEVSGIILALLTSSEADQTLIDKKIKRYLREAGMPL